MEDDVMSVNTYSLRDRILGAYVGSALGDALGGPVEGWHAGMIKAVYGRIEGFLRYTGRLHPGYALHAEPGAITDDTYIKDAFASFVLAYPDERDRTPMALARYLLAHADFSFWNPPDVTPLRRIESGEMTPEQTGDWYRIGGGAAWWTCFGIIHAGRPAEAYEETRRLSVIWKKPFERNLIGATQAAVAAALQQGATIESVTETLLQYAGPLARKLLDRAKRIAQTHRDDLDRFVEGIYAEALVAEGTGDVDGPMPPPAVPASPYRGATILWAEQIPLAYAAVIYGQGDLRRTMTACVSLGRDADSIASTCGSWIGGLVGLKGIPRDWVETIQRVNAAEIDLLARANRLADLAGA
jgi:hypothetical protein